MKGPIMEWTIVGSADWPRPINSVPLIALFSGLSLLVSLVTSFILTLLFEPADWPGTDAGLGGGRDSPDDGSSGGDDGPHEEPVPPPGGLMAAAGATESALIDLRENVAPTEE